MADHLLPEDVPEEEFTTITDINSIYDLFNEDKISSRELDRLKDSYYEWRYSPEQRTTVLRFYRQPDGTMTIYKKVYVETYGEGGSTNPAQLGTCYEDAWRYLIREGEGYLIHGSVQLTKEGARVKHAWVELPTGYVWEPQTGQHLTHEGFQMFSPMEEHRYTVEEAAIMVARVGKHGPWTDEQRSEWLGRWV